MKAQFILAPQLWLTVYGSIRKPMPPAKRVERPVKGGGYRRKDKHPKPYDTE